MTPSRPVRRSSAKAPRTCPEGDEAGTLGDLIARRRAAPRRAPPFWGKDAEGVLGGTNYPPQGRPKAGAPLWGKDAEGVLGGTSLHRFLSR